MFIEWQYAVHDPNPQADKEARPPTLASLRADIAKLDQFLQIPLNGTWATVHDDAQSGFGGIGKTPVAVDMP